MFTALLVWSKRGRDQGKRVEELLALSIWANLWRRTVCSHGSIQPWAWSIWGRIFGLAHEAQLKILELTAGNAKLCMRVLIGFRHGPKSLINDQTLVLVFGIHWSLYPPKDLTSMEVAEHDLPVSRPSTRSRWSVRWKLRRDIYRSSSPHIWRSLISDFAQGAKSLQIHLHQLVPSIW